MKKIVTAHLGNKVFQIEEDAYAYLNSFIRKKHNARELETEISELLLEKLSLSKLAITYPDVVDVLYQLGFSASDMQEQQQRAPENEKEKRLFRNPNDKMIGGVCSGLAEYFDIDPTLMRVLFVIAFFFGSMGLWAYIALWIIVPNKPKN